MKQPNNFYPDGITMSSPIGIKVLQVSKIVDQEPSKRSTTIGFLNKSLINISKNL
jgi:hypothetical protein